MKKIRSLGSCSTYFAEQAIEQVAVHEAVQACCSILYDPFETRLNLTNVRPYVQV